MSDTNSVDYILQTVAARGLRLANLFQFQVQYTDDWRWQANVTDGEKCWEFGRGRTAVEALRAALFAAANEPGTPIPKRRPSPGQSSLPDDWGALRNQGRKPARPPVIPLVEEDFPL